MIVTSTISNLGTTETTIYTCPVGNTSTISKLSLANVVDEDITFSISYYDSSADSTIFLIKNGHLSIGQKHDSISNSNTLTLNASDCIKVISNVPSSMHAIISYEEITS